MNAEAAPCPSSAPEAPLMPAKREREHGEKDVGVGVAVEEGVTEGVGPGVPEGEAPGEREGEGVGDDEEEGHSSRRTVCPFTSVKYVPEGVVATPQGAFKSATPAASPFAPPAPGAPAIVTTVEPRKGIKRSRLLALSAMTRFPAPSTRMS